MKSAVTVSVCQGCGADSPEIRKRLRAALEGASLAATVRGIDCMSGCTRPLAVGVRAPGKTAYLFGDLALADIPELVDFVRLYAAAPGGLFPDARVLGGLRFKAIARIPG